MVFTKKTIFHFFIFWIFLVFVGCGGQRDSTNSSTAVEAARGDEDIAKAFQEGRSGFWVESQGLVEKILPDDMDGEPHQRFIVRLSNTQTLLLAHNMAVAKRVEGIKVGDLVKFRGQYEWNDKGGLVHWTHRDPQGRHPSGWLEVHGKKYE